MVYTQSKRYYTIIFPVKCFVFRPTCVWCDNVLFSPLVSQSDAYFLSMVDVEAVDSVTLQYYTVENVCVCAWLRCIMATLKHYYLFHSHQFPSLPEPKIKKHCSVRWNTQKAATTWNQHNYFFSRNDRFGRLNHENRIGSMWVVWLWLHTAVYVSFIHSLCAFQKQLWSCECSLAVQS